MSKKSGEKCLGGKTRTIYKRQPVSWGLETSTELESLAQRAFASYVAENCEKDFLNVILGLEEIVRLFFRKI